MTTESKEMTRGLSLGVYQGAVLLANFTFAWPVPKYYRESLVRVGKHEDVR